ncbi:MAG: O-antigen ligase family protein [Thermoanaerobaculia bacterium]
MQETQPIIDDGSRERLGEGAFVLLLATSAASAFRVPFLGAGLPNLVFPLAAAVVLLSAWKRLGELFSRHALLLSSAAALLLWTAVAAAASPKPAAAARIALKAALYAAVFVALLVRFDGKERAGRSLRALLAFLVVLALLGVAESFFPQSFLYRLFRDDRSLSILPRISSILPWPNPYGVLMVAGVALSEGMAAARLVAPRPALLASLLFLAQVAQSGSRNAWGVAALVLAVTAVRALARRAPRRSVALAAFFAAGLVLLPVAAYQLRIERASPVARALLPEMYVGSSSLADPMLSLSLRGKIWRQAAVCVSYRPILGLGPGVFTRYVTPGLMGREGFNTHSLPLNLLVDLGLPGLALGLLVLASLRPSLWLARPAGGALAALLAGQLVDCFLYEPVTLLVLMSCAASVASPWEEP